MPKSTTVSGRTRVSNSAIQDRRGNVLVTTIVSVVVALVLIVGVGALSTSFFQSHAKPGAHLANQSITGFDHTQVRDVAATLMDNYRATLEMNGRQLQASAADLGITFDLDATVNAAMRAGVDATIVDQYNPFQTKNVPLSMSVDQDTLQTYLDATFVVDDQRSVPADVTYDADQQKFVVVPGKIGAQADAAAVSQALAQGAGISSPLTIPTTTEQPLISDDTAQKVADTANQQVAAPYLIKAGKKEYTIPAATLASWLVFSSDEEAGTITSSVDEAKATADIPGLLEQNLSKAPVSQQIMMGPSGGALGVSQDGEDGTKVADPAAVVAQVIAGLKAGQGTDVTAGVTTEPFASENVPMPAEYLQPNGAKWVEVDLSSYSVTRWEGTSALSTWSAVIGRSATPTSIGVFHVYTKLAKQTMRGEDYVQDDVPWIEYFNGDIGIHGNYWVTQMGQAASHGCVGLPVDLAKVMYDWIEIGTMVVVHQ